MFKRTRVEIRLEGWLAITKLNNLIKMVNKYPFVRIDSVHYYGCYCNSIRVVLSSPIRTAMALFYMEYAKDPWHEVNITWL